MKYQKLISKKIKELRLKHNLTQEEFAEKIGLSLNGVSNIERCRYQPTAETIDKICEEFNISPIELILPDSNQSCEEIKQLIQLKLANCDLEKLIKINNLIDIIKANVRRDSTLAIKK